MKIKIAGQLDSNDYKKKKKCKMEVENNADSN